MFVLMTDLDENLRAMAGLTLKNTMREKAKDIDPRAPSTLHIKHFLIQALEDPLLHIRSTAGSVITGLLEAQGLQSWPEVLQMLVTLMDNNCNNLQKLATVEGAISALHKICEDCGDKLNDENVGRPLNWLIPKLIQYAQFPHSPVVRWKSLACINQFVQSMPHALVVNMDHYLNAAKSLASDKNTQVRRYVCRAFGSTCEFHPQYIDGIFEDITAYMFSCLKDNDEMLSYEACEFLLMVGDAPACVKLVPRLKRFLNDLVPALLERMVYSDIEKSILEQDEQIVDKDTDIAPSKFFVTGRVVQHHDASAKQGEQQQQSLGEDDDSDDDDDYDDDDDDEDEFDYGEQEWNLRRRAASCIDLFSKLFRSELLGPLLPNIEARLQPQQPWDVRESAILALGAVSDGCMSGMYNHLSGLIPYLVQHLADVQPLIRSITCWTLSRYAKWIIEQPVDMFLKPVLEGVLRCMTDRHKRVQAASSSSFCVLAEHSGQILSPFLPSILQVLKTAFGIYHRKNTLILFDAVGTLADQVGSDLNREDHIQVLMPVLIHKWSRVKDDDPMLFPLFESLTYVSSALKQGFLPFVQPFFERCIRLITSTYINDEAAVKTGQERPAKDTVIVSLDFVSGMIEGLKQSIAPLIANSRLMEILWTCCQDESMDVRQSAFGVVGDLARSGLCPHQHLLSFVPVLIENMNPEAKSLYSRSTVISVCNNATWATGEIAVQVKDQIRQFVPVILQRLIPVMKNDKLHISLLENTAICIGRLSLVCPNDVAVALEDATFVVAWLSALRNIYNATEKVHTFQGICTLIRSNTNAAQAMLRQLVYLCDAIAFYEQPTPELKQEFSQILNGFKNSLGPQQWASHFGQFPADLRSTLQQEFGL